MADIRPFRAFFYASRLRKQLPKLVCPPYDIISAEQQKSLLKGHPLNFVRAELPSGPDNQKYSRAASLWRDWRRKNVIEEDSQPSIYIYESRFRSKLTGRLRVRRGFFAAMRLVPWGRGVFPHEKTLPTPKKDRMKLFKSLRVQTSPIQCLFQDNAHSAGRLLAKSSRRSPWISFADHDGVLHLLWRAEPEQANLLRKILKRSPVVIADGHHRYETSRAYASSTGASGYVMTYFSPADDPGLEILPTHRAVPETKARFVNLHPWGRENEVPNLQVLLRRLEQKGAHLRREIGTAHNGKFFLYRLGTTPPEVKNTPLAKLAVACLHSGPLSGLGKEDFFFSRNPKEALTWARRNRGWAFFLSSSSVNQVCTVAVSGHVMPPKSTYFFPKIPSGILSHSLHEKS